MSQDKDSLISEGEKNEEKEKNPQTPPPSDAKAINH